MPAQAPPDRQAPQEGPEAPRRSTLRRALSLAPYLLALLPAIILAIALALFLPEHASMTSPLESNPELEPGTALPGRPAPSFTLTDQFGQRVSLASFRGKAVVLAFNDSQCLGVCPLTTAEMALAKQMLGGAASQVQLLGVDANPTATSVADVRAYSALHGLMSKWYFLTGSLAQLKAVWHAYGIEARVVHGLVDHTPAVYVISPSGSLVKVYMTPMAYAGRDQQAQILARELASLLPGHPRVHASLSYQRITPYSSHQEITLARLGGGSVRLGADGAPHLLVFFASWDREVEDLGAHLSGLEAYRRAAAAEGLPQLVGVDVAPVEPSAQALPDFLRTLPAPLRYPIAIDASGRLADLYTLEEEPWFVLTSATGKVLWYYDAAASGWPSESTLLAQVRASLAKVSPVQASAARALAGSPAPLAGLHAQGAQILPGGERALAARIAALRGYPIVVNAWASWCSPCRREAPLLQSAALHFGRQVAFLGADTEDPLGSARSFLAEHPFSYPSYQTSEADLNSLAPVTGLPDTIFISPTGKVVGLHIGEYASLAALYGEVQAHLR
jgi:cytochrome oxidase Cu insertion factor (SCO1/SenC/PrrC family)/thiol-disulfide isomerase/thioredoxin